MMFDFIRTMTNSIKAFVKNNSSAKPISRDNVHQRIDMINSSLTTTLSWLAMLKTDNYLEKLKASVANTNDNSKVGVSSYNVFVKGLTGIAYTQEKKQMFDSLNIAIRNYLEILTELDKKLDTLLTEKSINVYNVQISSVAVFGIIEDADILANWVAFLVDTMVCDLTGTPAIKYRELFVSSYRSKVIDLVNRSVNSKLADTFFKDIANLKNSGGDVYVVNEQGETNLGMSESVLSQMAAKGLFGEILTNFNIFRIMGESWNIARHARFLRLQREKAWMESNVALLKLSLDEYSPDSKEYVRLKKIIEGYSDHIAKADRSISNYMGK